MKIKDLLKELEYFDPDDELDVFAYDKDLDIEYECEIRMVEGDIIPMLILDVVKTYEGGVYAGN